MQDLFMMIPLKNEIKDNLVTLYISQNVPIFLSLGPN